MLEKINRMPKIKLNLFQESEVEDVDADK